MVTIEGQPPKAPSASSPGFVPTRTLTDFEYYLLRLSTDGLHPTSLKDGQNAELAGLAGLAAADTRKLLPMFKQMLFPPLSVMPSCTFRKQQIFDANRAVFSLQMVPHMYSAETGDANGFLIETQWLASLVR